MKDKVHTATINEITITNYPNKLDPTETVTITEIKKGYAEKYQKVRQVQENFLNNITPYLISQICSDLILYGEVDEQKIIQDFTQKNTAHPKG